MTPVWNTEPALHVGGVELVDDLRGRGG